MIWLNVKILLDDGVKLFYTDSVLPWVLFGSMEGRGMEDFEKSFLKKNIEKFLTFFEFFFFRMMK